MAVAGTTDLVEATATLVGIASESRQEAAIADHVEGRLRRLPWLEVDRVGDNVVARTPGRHGRVLLAGHLDTVPANANAEARIEGDTLWGLGSADMKGGLAVMLELAAALESPRLPVTFVFYAREEIDRAHNGLLELDAARPDLLEGDVAILGEPTGAVAEAGCQGVLKVEVVVGGRRAHAARPWTGVNAIHRLGPLLAAIVATTPREPVLDGCRYREALSAVRIGGGVATNVVPDQAALTLSHRFAPDRSDHDAATWVHEVLAPHLDESLGDSFEVVDRAPAAAPGLDHPVLAALVRATGSPPRAKLGWTDVAFFAGRGTPAVNFGPGDPEVAHRADERVVRGELDAVHQILLELLGGEDGPSGPSGTDRLRGAARR